MLRPLANFEKFSVESYNENAGGLRRFYDDVFGPQPGNTNTRPTTTTSKINILNNSPSTNTQSITTTTSTATTVATTTSSIITKITSNILMESSSSPIVTRSTRTTEYDYYTTRATTSKTSTNTYTPKTVTTSPITINRVQKKHLLFSKTTHEATSNILTSPTARHDVPHVYTTNQPVKPRENIDTQTKSSGQKLLNKLHTTQKPDTVGIELSQAAAELENEFDVDFPNVNVLKHESQKLSVTWRGSTRVHLAGSTRYPIPLPENNAFCYTNPKSALCRTFI
ncbi:unnamed protein product [Euphydryas editha]|uniref:Uncharacterized protein n=1 Tax=Euphydryas editha TaxID=104508 RepID=A0AAU9V0E7_EUPED|nr:unnamed protein product [Euphydryas editha]